MKLWKVTLLTVCSFFSVAAAVLIASCEKDACTELKCKNGSACTDGFCRCQTGYEGSECQTKTINRFLGTFYGYNHCDALPALQDTLDVLFYAEPNVVDIGLHHHYTAERFKGTVDGYSITVPDQVTSTEIRKVRGELRGTEMHIVIERDNVNDASEHSICEFVGTIKH